MSDSEINHLLWKRWDQWDIACLRVHDGIAISNLLDQPHKIGMEKDIPAELPVNTQINWNIKHENGITA